MNHPDRDDSLFPTSRMPMGLLQYMVQFFVSESGQHVSTCFCMFNYPLTKLCIMQVVCTDDYLEWLQSMHILFGTKWAKLHCGPLGSVQPPTPHRGAFDPLTVSDLVFDMCH